MPLPPDVIADYQIPDESDGAFAQRLDLLYRDLDQAEAASRELMYLHLGQLIGIVMRLTGTERLPRERSDR